MKDTDTHEPALDRIRHPKKRRLLAVFTQTANIVKAARAAGIARCTHYYWRDSDPDYARAFEEAKRQSLDIAESELMERGVVGVPRYRFYQGKPILNPETGKPLIEYAKSDVLLMFHLKALAPEKYRDSHIPPVEDDGVRIAGRSREEVIREEIAARQNALDMLKKSGSTEN